MIRQYYYIAFTSFVYVRLKVLIWVGDGLMYSTNLSKTSGDILTEIYNTVENYRPIIIDCKGVDGLTDHSWDLLFKSIGAKKRQVIFTNYLPIEEKINYSLKEYCSTATVEKEQGFFIIYYDSKSINFTHETIREINTQLKKNFQNALLSSYCSNEENSMKLLSSTPFKASGEYNATLIISDPERFIWTSITFSDFIQDKIIEHKIGLSLLPIMFLSVSLRSAPIAAAVSLLLNKKIITIEHLGPMRKYFYPQSYIRNEHYEYIYIGDFSFAGTEIRMTKMFATLTGSKLEHAFVLGSLFSSERFEDFHLHSCTDLRLINTNARYELF